MISDKKIIFNMKKHNKIIKLRIWIL